MALKLLLQLPLYWAAWAAARVGPTPSCAGWRSAHLRLGAGDLWRLLLVEALHRARASIGACATLIGDPIRPDLGRKNVAQGSFVLALLWPVAAAGGFRAGAPAWLALPMAAGTVLLAQTFLLGRAGAGGGPGDRGRRPGLGLAPVRPKVLAAGRGWSDPADAGPADPGRRSVLGLGRHLPDSWEQRDAATGPTRWSGSPSIPCAAGAWTPAARSARTIQLHPHNGALQIWLRAGRARARPPPPWPGPSPSAGLARDQREPGRRRHGAAPRRSICSSASVSFGVWQEWWLALGGSLVAVIAARRVTPKNATTQLKPIDAARPFE